MAKTCFVISPIGTENSDTRDHADDVFDFIIAPAAERAGYTAKRGDHSGAPGKITEQMFHSILNDDLIVAIITDRNPNVFYELAVAQSAARLSPPAPNPRYTGEVPMVIAQRRRQ